MPNATPSSTLSATTLSTKLLKFLRSPFSISTRDSSVAAPSTANAKWQTRFIYSISCPPHGTVAKVLTRSLTAVSFWLVLYGTVKQDALPGGKFFALWLLVVGGLVCGWLSERARLPALFGMLVFGFALRNIPGVLMVGAALDSSTNGGRVWAAQLRNIALGIILLRAGLGLDQSAMQRLKWAILTLAVLPACSVVLTMLIAAHWLLALPFMWSLLLGLVSCSVSPAVIVPLMLLLQEQRYGTQKGIPSVLITACTVCSVIAVCGFGLVLGLIFSGASGSSASLTFNIMRAPIEIGIGIVYGALIGTVLWYVPGTTTQNTTTYRFLLLVGGGIGAITCGKALNISGAGILGCLLLALVCRNGWDKRDAATIKNGGSVKQIASALKVIWLYAFQPLLFGLIGTAVSIRQAKIQTLVGALSIIAIAHAVQILVTFAAVSLPYCRFSLRERIFLCIAWIPKATIQAAIGSVALDTVREQRAKLDTINPDAKLLSILNTHEKYAQDILTTAVLLILITAPIGAVCIMLSSKKLLSLQQQAMVPISTLFERCESSMTTTTVAAAAPDVLIGIHPAVSAPGAAFTNCAFDAADELSTRARCNSSMGQVPCSSSTSALAERRRSSSSNRMRARAATNRM